MKKILLFLLLFLVYHSASAYRILWGRSVTISQPVFEDLYVAGGTVTINAVVYGDLIVAGGTIHLNDTVTNDLLLGGGTVYINGYIADDVRCAGGELHVLKNIGGDLVITGGKVEISRGVLVSGGLVTGGGNIKIDGTIAGPVKSTGGEISFNGTAQSSFDARSEKLFMNGTVDGPSVLAARHVEIGNQAAFNNPVRYWNKKGSLDFRQTISNGGASFDPSLKIKGSNWYFLGHSSILGLIWYLSTVFIFLVLIQYLFSNSLKKAGNTVSHSIFKSLLWGFAFFVGVPILVLLLLITIIGIPIGIILMVSYIGIMILATIIASLVIANWYNTRLENKWGFWQVVLAGLALFILFKLITFTPFLGWFIMLVIACIALGSILRNVHWRRHPGVSVQ
jgi:hypothetical protein